MRPAASLLVLTSLAMMPLAPASAQTTAPERYVSLDLNALQPSEGGCRLTFVVANDLATTIDRAAYEMALFDKAGVVDRLTVLDFKSLPSGKTRVSRFDLKGVDCANVGRVLINDATECTGPGTAPDACLAALETRSTSGVTFGR
ncbi:MAG: hypothetical protein KF694_12300 [Mesorhizobium sp.]|nr:hypothetical protein [Mesorhizobium sp.]